MGKVAAEPYRDIDFSQGKRGPVAAFDTGKTKISIRLDNAVLDHFRRVVDAAGGGNYQTLINDSLVTHIRQQSMLVAVRKVVREEIAKLVASRAPAARGGRRDA
jgi:BrnA antitoxin of type II toxin-antitoxin system